MYKQKLEYVALAVPHCNIFNYPIPESDIIFELYIDYKIPENCFLLQVEPEVVHLSVKTILFECYYSSPEWTNLVESGLEHEVEA